LVNEPMAAGDYTRTFNAAGMATGVYFVKFEGNNFMQTQKITLMK